VNDLDFPKYIVKCCQGCIFKQLLQNNTELSSQLFIVFLSCYSFKILPAKPPGFQLLFIFIYISTGHTHFPNNEISIPRMPMRLNTLFFGCRTSESRLGKPALKCVDVHYTQFSIGKETHLRGSAYLCVSAI